MQLWFEIAVVLALFATIAKLQGIEHNIANFGTRPETKFLERLETAIPDQGNQGNFDAFSHWLTTNFFFSHRSCSLSDWQCWVVLLCSARLSVRLSKVSAFLWLA